MTDLYWEDGFNRDDSTTVGENWQTTGALQIVNGSLRQSGASSTANAFAVQETAAISSALGGEFALGAMVACDDDTTLRQFDLILRGSDSSITDAYWVSLVFENDVATLKIVKRVDSSNATAASLVVTDEMEKVSSSYDDVFQRLSARIVEEDGNIRIDAYLNDEQKPILSATDVSYPLLKNGTYFGMRFSDADAGVDGHLFVDNFFIQAIPTAVADFEEVDPAYWTLGRLIASARGISLRDSSDGTKSEVWSEFANMAQQEYFEALGRPDWGEQIYTFQFKANATAYELPSWVDSHDSTMLLGTDGYNIKLVDEAQWREDQAYDPTVSGTPWIVKVGGRGRSGGIELRPFPVPTSDTSATLRVFARPRLMRESSDVPAVPQGEAHHLVYGMAHLHSLSDNSRTAISAWSMKWQQALKMARKQQGRRKTLGRHSGLRPGIRPALRSVGWNGRSRGMW